MSGVNDALRQRAERVRELTSQLAEVIVGITCRVSGCNYVEDGVCLCKEAAKLGDWGTAAKMKALCGNEKARGMIVRHEKGG